MFSENGNLGINVTISQTSATNLTNYKNEQISGYRAQNNEQQL